MQYFQFQQNEVVSFDDGVNVGKGQVVGCTTVSQPVIGRCYCVKVMDGRFPNETYPFDTIAVFEMHLKSLGLKDPGLQTKGGRADYEDNRSDVNGGL